MPVAAGVAPSLNAAKSFAVAASYRGETMLGKMPAEIAFSCADACSIVTPGFKRPKDARNHTSERARPDRAPRKIASAQIGIATSKLRPTSRPWNDGGV